MAASTSASVDAAGSSARSAEPTVTRSVATPGTARSAAGTGATQWPELIPSMARVTWLADMMVKAEGSDTCLGYMIAYPSPLCQLSCIDTIIVPLLYSTTTHDPVTEGRTCEWATAVSRSSPSTGGQSASS